MLKPAFAAAVGGEGGTGGYLDGKGGMESFEMWLKVRGMMVRWDNAGGEES